MENASKALIMAAEILFGVILITMFIGAYYSWNNLASNINKNIETTKVQEFNSRFTVYDKTLDSKAHDLTAYDVISIVNFVKEYNGQIEDDDYYKIVIVGNSGLNEKTGIKDISKFVNENKDVTFSLKITKYNELSGRVKEILLTKK